MNRQNYCSVASLCNAGKTRTVATHVECLSLCLSVCHQSAGHDRELYKNGCSDRCGPCNSFHCLSDFNNVYDDDGDNDDDDDVPFGVYTLVSPRNHHRTGVRINRALLKIFGALTKDTYLKKIYVNTSA